MATEFFAIIPTVIAIILILIAAVFDVSHNAHRTSKNFLIRLLIRLSVSILFFLISYFILFSADLVISLISGLIGFLVIGLVSGRKSRIVVSTSVEQKPQASREGMLKQRETPIQENRSAPGLYDPPQLSVFVSYRRSSSKFIARSIFEDLRHNGYNVFMDVESIDSGEFEKIILNQIAARAHFLIILTPGSLERCVEPNDWLRREIEHAISLRRNVVPILVDNFRFEDNRKYLVGNLMQLESLNGLPLYHEYFEEGMNKLRNRFLKQPVYGILTPAPSEEQPIVQRKINKVVNEPQPSEDDLNAEGYLERGNLSFYKDDFNTAIASYNRAIELKPDLVPAYLNRGVANHEKGEFDKAIIDFSRAIELDPRDPQAYTRRGLVYEQQNELRKAYKDYSRAILLDPSYARPYYYRGNVRRYGRDVEGAIDDYQRYIALDGGKRYGNQTVVETLIRELSDSLTSPPTQESR
jgi:tetratricopeptide (TPR) repeat protein